MEGRIGILKGCSFEILIWALPVQFNSLKIALKAVAFYLYKGQKSEFGQTYPVVPGWHFSYHKKLNINRGVNTTLNCNIALVVS